MSIEKESALVVAKAAGRVFRAYERHTEVMDEDALFTFLNSLVSLGDKLNQVDRPNLNPSQNYRALRELRNLFHHETELLSTTRTFAAEKVSAISTDLLLLCLVPKASVDVAIDRAKNKADRTALRLAVHWYGQVVNIEPTIFNVMVDVFELLSTKEIDVDDQSFHRFRSSYRFETANGYPHRVNGQISAHVGEVQTVLEALMDAGP